MQTMSKRKWTVAAAALLLMIGGTAAAQQSGASAGGTDHGAADRVQHHGGSSGGGHSEGEGRGGMGHGGMGHGGGMMMGGSGGMDHESEGHDGKEHGGKEHGGGMMMKHMCRPGEHIDGRLAYAKAELKLTDAQTPQWNAFAEAYRTSAQKVGQYCASMKDQMAKGMPSGILQQLGMMERNMTAHLEFVRTVKGAAEPLFAVLTDEQKKIAEETMSGVMGLGMGGMMGGMGGMMGKH